MLSGNLKTDYFKIEWTVRVLYCSYLYFYYIAIQIEYFLRLLFFFNKYLFLIFFLNLILLNSSFICKFYGSVF